MERVYAAIDYKSFYASVECMHRGLDPLRAHLVVADESRTSKTICLAVSPAMKALGLPGRCRLFEVEKKVREYEARSGKKLSWVIAPPRMQAYMEESARLYRDVYLRYVSEEDIHVYSIDEVFLDLTSYMSLYRLPPHDLVRNILRDILAASGITATAGIGTNLYLAKIAMDIVAKHMAADKDGTRIAELDESAYRRLLWPHMPLTDFWRVGKHTAERLEKFGLYTMGDIARFSCEHEDTLYREFGVNAELLIDHAWGKESCTIADIQNFKPENQSMTAGQVLPCSYTFEDALTVVLEMTDQMTLDMVTKGMMADEISLYIGYDVAAPSNDLVDDWYGRAVPRPANGSIPITNESGHRTFSSSTRQFMQAAEALYRRIVNPALPVRRIYLAFMHTTPKEDVHTIHQTSFFTHESELAEQEAQQAREYKLQKALLSVRAKYGKNLILKGISLQENATARERNEQIGGHRSGNSGEHTHTP